jgi:hypothetical protein
MSESRDHLKATPKPKPVCIDVTKIDSVDSLSNALPYKSRHDEYMESVNISVRHRFAESSHAYSVLKDALVTLDKFNCELVDDPGPIFLLTQVLQNRIAADSPLIPPRSGAASLIHKSDS